MAGDKIRKIDISSVHFNKSAEFYESKNKKIEQNFKEFWKDLCCSRDIELISEIESNSLDGLRYAYFTFLRKADSPSFCDETKIGWLKEQKSGYCLIVYNKQYVAVLKLNVSLSKVLTDSLKKIDYSKLVNYSVKGKTEFKYLNMRNTEGSDYAVRTKAFEGVDLSHNITAVGSSKYFIQTMRGRSGDATSFAINFGTSRLNKYLQKQSVNDIVNWVKVVFNSFDSSPNKNNEFLENFARRKPFTNFNDYPPSSILFNFGPICRLLENQNVCVEENGVAVPTQIMIDRILDIECSKDVDIDSKGYFVKDVIPWCVRLVDKNEKITIKCPQWKKIKILGTPEEEYDGDLESIANRMNVFNIYFSGKSEVYSSGCLFLDTKLLGSINWLLKFIIPEPALGNVSYEKYDEDKYTQSTAPNWNPASEFAFVENKFGSNFDILICDDCKKEWADFIGINSDCVEFFACKYKSVKRGSYSASYFQDVVGQAIKNLENFSPTQSQIKEKKTEWEDFICDGSTMKRIRKKKRNKTLESSVNVWVGNVSNPKYTKISSLVVNFLSFEKLKSSFKALAKDDGLNKQMGHREEAYQQLCILSNFVHSCLELNIEPRIYCQE